MRPAFFEIMSGDRCVGHLMVAANGDGKVCLAAHNWKPMDVRINKKGVRWSDVKNKTNRKPMSMED